MSARGLLTRTSFSGNQNRANNDSVTRNQNITHTSTMTGNGRINTDSSANPSSRDSGFGSMNRTNHDRSNTFGENSNTIRNNNTSISRPPTSNTFGQNSNNTRPNNTSMLPPPAPSNSVASNLPSSSGQNRFSFDSSSGADEEIVCSCNVQAKLLTVRKEGPNTGNMIV